MPDVLPDWSTDNDLVRLILAQSVPIPRSKANLLEDMKSWCLENVGEMRHYHPLTEAEEGWIDYFDGDWAVDYDRHRTGWSFWFAKKDHRVLFQLTWT